VNRLEEMSSLMRTIRDELTTMLDLVLAIEAALSVEDIGKLTELLAGRDDLMQKLGPDIQKLRQMEQTIRPDPEDLQKQNQLLADIKSHDQGNIQTTEKLRQLYQDALFENKQHKQMLRYAPGSTVKTEKPHYLDTKS